MLGLLIAVVGGYYILSQYVLKSWLWDRLILKTHINEGSRKPATYIHKPVGPLIKSKGVSITDLHPWGEVEVNDERYQTKTEVGSIDKGTTIEVVDKDSFGIIVRSVES